MTSIDDPGHEHPDLPDAPHTPSERPELPKLAFTASLRSGPSIDVDELAKEIAPLVLMYPEMGGPPFVVNGQAMAWYVDLWAIVTSPYYLDEVATALADTILYRLPGNPYADRATRPTRIAGIETLSIPFAIATSLEIGLPAIIMRREANLFGPRRYKGRVSNDLDEQDLARSMIEGRLDASDIVVILAGVVGQGFELTRAALILQNFGIPKQQLYATSIVDREEGATRLLAEAGIPYMPLFTKTSLGVGV